MADQVEEVKRKTDIVSIVSEHIDLKKAGRNFKALCPFHSEKTPSFMVSPELQIFKCFGCFPAGELVKTPFGLHKIQDVIKGEYAISGKGQIKKVLATHKRDYEGDVVTVRLSKLTEPVNLTSDHMVYVVGGSTLYSKKYKYLSKRLNFYQKYPKKVRLAKIWHYFPIKKVKAGNLQKGMTLLYPLDLTVRDTKTIDLSKYITKKWPPHGTKPLIPPLQIELNEDFLKLVGYYIAEGSHHRAYIRFSLGNHEEDFAKEIVLLIKRLFGLEASIHKRTGGKTGIEITACNSILADLFGNLCGKGAENKHIPFVFQQLPQNKQRVLLEAIFKGDGRERIPHKTKNTFREITTVSRVLSEQLRDTLLRLGYFPSSMVQGGKRDKSLVSHKESYTVNWPVESNVSKFKHVYERKDGSKYWLLPVRKTEKRKFEGSVYNLTIEGDHSYVANTFAVANCGESGDVFTFLEKYEGMDFPEALRFLADRAQVELKTFRSEARGEKERLFQLNSFTSKLYHYLLLKHRIGRAALAYLTEDRGLQVNTIKKFQLGFSPPTSDALRNFLIDKKKFRLNDLQRAGLIIARGRGFFDRFAGRVIFPLFDHRGNIAGFAGRVLPSIKNSNLAKYVNSPETPIYHKGRLLYGLNLTRESIKEKKSAVVVEGELDLISSWQIGVKNIVATKGSALTEDQVRLLSRFTKCLTLALDTDLAGDAAARRGVTMAQGAGLEVRVASLGKYKDPDEMARHAPLKLKSALKDAKGAWDFVIDSVFAKHDISSGQGKANLSREILPILAGISDKIVQAHYLEVVAAKLKVPVEAVTGQLLEIAGKEKISEPKLAIAPQKAKKGRRELLEQRLLILTFQSDPSLLTKKENYSLITTSLNKRILEEYRQFAKTHRKFDPSTFAEKLPKELLEGFAEMILVDTQGLIDRPDSLQKELKVVKGELKILAIKEELKEVGSQIKELEEANKKQKLEKAKKLFTKLTEELSSLEEDNRRGIILMN